MGGVAAMEVVRDLVIIILGTLSLLLFILAGILGILIYRDIRRLTLSVKGAINTIKDISAESQVGLKYAQELIGVVRSFRGSKKE